jgi:hypothetical protein
MLNRILDRIFFNWLNWVGRHSVVNDCQLYNVFFKDNKSALQIILYTHASWEKRLRMGLRLEQYKDEKIYIVLLMSFYRLNCTNIFSTTLFSFLKIKVFNNLISLFFMKQYF